MILCCWICWETKNSIIYCLDVPDMIEYGSILLEFCSQDNFISVGCDEVNLVIFACALLTGDIFHDLLHHGWLFSTNYENTNIGYLSWKECSVTWNIVISLIDISHVMMLTTISNGTDWIAPWWKSYRWLKDLIFNEGVIRDNDFYYGESLFIYEF